MEKLALSGCNQNNVYLAICVSDIMRFKLMQSMGKTYIRVSHRLQYRAMMSKYTYWLFGWPHSLTQNRAQDITKRIRCATHMAVHTVKEVNICRFWGTLRALGQVYDIFPGDPPQEGIAAIEEYGAECFACARQMQ